MNSVPPRRQRSKVIMVKGLRGTTWQVDTIKTTAELKPPGKFLKIKEYWFFNTIHSLRVDTRQFISKINSLFKYYLYPLFCYSSRPTLLYPPQHHEVYSDFLAESLPVWQKMGRKYLIQKWTTGLNCVKVGQKCYYVKSVMKWVSNRVRFRLGELNLEKNIFLENLKIFWYIDTYFFSNLINGESSHTSLSLSIFIFKPQRGSKSAETHTKMTKLEWRDTQLESTHVLILLIIRLGF